MGSYFLSFIVGLIYLAIFKVKFTFWNAMGAGVCAMIVFGSGVMLAGALAFGAMDGGQFFMYLLFFAGGILSLYMMVYMDRKKKAQVKKLFCPRCGKQTLGTDQYCTKCGYEFTVTGK